MKTFLILLSIFIASVLLAASLFIGHRFQISATNVFIGVIACLSLIAMLLYRSTDKTLINEQAHQLLTIGRNLILIGGVGTLLLLAAYYTFTKTLP